MTGGFAVGDRVTYRGQPTEVVAVLAYGRLVRVRLDDGVDLVCLPVELSRAEVAA